MSKIFDELEKQLFETLSEERMLDILDEMIALDFQRAIDTVLYMIREGETELRVFGLEVLAQLEDISSPEILESLFSCLLDQTTWDVRHMAAQVLSRLASSDVIAEMGTLLDDDDWDLVAHIVEALGMMGKAECVPLVMHCLEHPHYFVRKRAMEALGKLPWDATVEKNLLDMLQDQPKETTIKIIQTLSESHSFKILKDMQQLMETNQVEDWLVPLLIEAINAIRGNLRQLLQLPVHKPGQIENLVDWLESGVDTEMAPEILKALERGVYRLSELSRAEQEHLTYILLQMHYSPALPLQKELLRQALELDCLYLPEILDPTLIKELELILVDYVFEQTDENPRFHALTLLNKYASVKSMPQLFPLLSEASSAFEHILPIFQEQPEATLQLFHNALTQQRLSSLTLERMLEIVAPFQSDALLSFLLRMMNQTLFYHTRTRLISILIDQGPAIVEPLLLMLKQYNGLDFIFDAVQVLKAFEIPQDAIDILFPLFLTTPDDIQESIALLLAKVSGKTEEILDYALRPGGYENQTERAMTVLVRRDDLPALIRVWPDYRRDPQARKLFYKIWVAMATRTEYDSAWIKLTQHSDPVLRLMIYKLMAELNRPQFMQALVNGLNEPVPALALWAERYLHRQNAEIINPLLVFYQNYPEKEEAVRKLLCNQHSDALVESLGQQSKPQVQALLLEVLGNHQLSLDLLRPFLKATEMRLKLAAINALQPPHPTTQALYRALDDPNLKILRAAIAALGRVGGDNDTKRLKAFLSHPEREIQAETIKALSRLTGKAWLPELRYYLEVAENEDNRFLYQACIQAMGYMDDLDVYQELLGLLAGLSDPLLVSTALDCLTQEADPPWVQDLLKMYLQIDSQDIQRLFRHYLALFNNEAVWERLQTDFASLEQDEKRDFISSLISAEHAYSLLFLKSQLTSENWHCQRDALTVLSEYQAPEVLPWLFAFQSYLIDDPTIKGWILRSQVKETIELRQTYPGALEVTP